MLMMLLLFQLSKTQVQWHLLELIRKFAAQEQNESYKMIS